MGRKRSEEVADVLDGGHGWVIVFGSFLGHMLVLGIQYSFGVTFARLVDDFDEARSAVAWVGSLTIGFQLGMGALSGLLVAKYGERLVIVTGGFLAGASLLAASFATNLWHLYITYGALLGLACSWIWPPCMLVVQKWFSKRRSLASGVASCGSGVGTMSLGPAVSWLADNFGWRIAFRWLGAFALTLSLIVAFLCRPPRIGNDAPKRKISAPYLYAGKGQERALLRCFPLQLLMLSAAIAGLGWFVPVVHIVQCTRDRGFPKEFQDLVVSVVGFGLLTGRVPMCWFADWWGRRTRALALVTAFLGVACFILSVADSFGAMLFGAFFFGWNAGAYVALTPPVIKDFMTLDELPQAAGLVYTAWGWTLMLGPPLAGFIYSQVSPTDYLIPFIVAGSFLTLGSATLLVLEIIVQSQKARGASSNGSVTSEAGSEDATSSSAGEVKSSEVKSSAV